MQAANPSTSVELKGKVSIPEFMHDTDLDELVVDIHVDSSKDQPKDFRSVVREQLVTKGVMRLLQSFTDELMQHHADDVKIPDAEMKGHPVLQSYSPKPVASDDGKPINTAAKAMKGSLVTVTQKVEFVCSASDLFAALLDPKRVHAWSRASAKAKTSPGFYQKGDAFSLFDSNVTGQITDVVKLSRDSDLSFLTKFHFLKKG